MKQLLTPKKKNKVIYSETYKHGTSFNDRTQILEHLKNCETVFALRSDKYDDGKESFTIKIDRV